MPKSIWISTGELSGEMHGAALAKALLFQDPTLTVVGMGGEMMANAGVDVKFSIEELSVMGFTEVLSHLPHIVRLLSRIRATLKVTRPDAIIVIDAPDFNFRIIGIAKKLGIPVYYYISPKLWAWRQGRAKFIQKNIRKLLSILPFEVPFYQRFGIAIDYVGNPLVDMVNYPAIECIQPQETSIGILPGSRKREVSSLMPIFGEAARGLLSTMPDLTFTCIKAPNMKEDYIRSFWPKDIPLSVISSDNRWESMRHCKLLFAASGTVTLESALAGVPTIVAYKLSKITYFLGTLLIKVPFISLPNLIAEKEVFPELVQNNCTADNISRIAYLWLTDKKEYFSIIEQLQSIRIALGEAGATQRAAHIILEDLATL